MKRFAWILGALVACGGANQTTTLTSATPKPPDPNDLLVETAACWLGGMWSDVQGEVPKERTLSTLERCDSVVVAVFGGNGRDAIPKLRAHEPETVAAVRAVIAKARDESLVHLFDTIDRAEYETMLARRAAHRITRDAAREAGVLDTTEVASLKDLEASSAFDALPRASEGGDHQKEARVFMLLVALDRMRVAEELPVHLKPYVIAEPLRVIFDVPAPELSHDASKPLPRGGWLAYLESAALSAHHPVVDPNKPPLARHEEAVAGILQGIAGELTKALDGLDEHTELPRVTRLFVRGLEQSRDRAL